MRLPPVVLGLLWLLAGVPLFFTHGEAHSGAGLFFPGFPHKSPFKQATTTARFRTCPLPPTSAGKARWHLDSPLTTLILIVPLPLTAVFFHSLARRRRRSNQVSSKSDAVLLVRSHHCGRQCLRPQLLGVRGSHIDGHGELEADDLLLLEQDLQRCRGDWRRLLQLDDGRSLGANQHGSDEQPRL